eukprot:Skav202057  [mRNA]  locus=scaffold1138:524948:527531:- [translate_table: standard]
MEAEDFAAQAAERAKEIQRETEDLLLQIRRATDIESKHIEQQRLELQSKHAEKIKEMQAEVRRIEDLTDDSVHQIEAEMQREQAQIEEDVLQMSAARREALKTIKQEADDFSAAADQEYQESLEKEKQLHATARKALADMDQERWRKVEQMEQTCQMWIAAFNQRPARLEETQADLAFRVDHLVGEARAARLRLHEARQLQDRQWEEELERLRQEALKERIDAASSLDQARLKRRELQGISREKSCLALLFPAPSYSGLAGIEECKLMKHQHLQTLRRIADELDQMWRNIGLQARDSILVQSLKELAFKTRQGQMKQQPPKRIETTRR